jgi:uncharacterized protein YcbK (DUF882 family)
MNSNSLDIETVDARRRRFLKVATLATAGLIVEPAWGKLRAGGERALTFYHTHTEETLRTVYWAQGGYLSEGLIEIDHILRDFRTGEIETIDPKLLDLLYALQHQVGSRKAFHIISGYRSPATNEMLRHTGGGGVAKKSLHMLGQAADIRLPGCQLSQLHRAAIALNRGGVGYYPRSNFIHVDTGRVRTW